MTEAGPTCSRVPSSRYPLALLGFFLLLCVLMHAKSFSVSHIEGDEIVYLTLAREMNWDFSGYSTQHDAAVRRFPHSIYRQELFHHPPLYPLVLKIGMLFQQAVFFGLAFQVLAMALLLIFARRAAQLCELPPRLQAVLYAGMTFGPLLMFSTGRLHHDGLLAIFLFCERMSMFPPISRGGKVRRHSPALLPSTPQSDDGSATSVLGRNTLPPASASCCSRDRNSVN